LFRLTGPVRLVNTPVSAGTSFSNQDVHRTLKALSQSARPVLVMGSGAMADPSKAQALATAVRKLGIPVYLSGMARGLLGPADPLQCLHERKKALKTADCIVLAGVPADFRLDYGRQFNRTARLIAISRNKPDLTMNMPAVYLARQTDPARFLVVLSASASGLPDWSNWKKTLQEYQQSRETGIDNMATESMAGINPVALFRSLGKTLPPNSVLVADGGDFAATASYTLRPGQPLHWLDPGVFGTLGAGGGFALGAALQYRDDYVWIIYGDGSAAYSLAEFDIFTRHNLKVCAIIGNNGSWEQIARDQVDILGSDVAVNLPQSDYQYIGAAFGAAGERVDNLKDFEQAVQKAIQSMDRGVPYIINAITGKSSFRKGSISM
jgi:thiamine pyrophosphate-dependent acetolactate synthase large subunit-like protein